MLELFLALIDRVLALAKTRSENNEKWFGVISSLHKELIGIHTNYLAFFERARLDLASGVSPKDVLDRLRERRLEMEAVRHSLRAVVPELAHTAAGGPDYRLLFFLRLSVYLEIAGDGVRYSSASSNMVDAMETILRGGYPDGTVIEDFQQILGDTLAELRERFDGVAAAYAVAQAKSI